jgi:tRNA (guanosine-2'-O-)-methyltransferase
VSDAVDRRMIASELSRGKTSRWPRTDRRANRIRNVLSRRQPDLTVVLENVHDPHNVSAVLRSCDATGVLRVHTVYSMEERPHAAFARTTSAGAAKWVEVVHHDSVAECYDDLRRSGIRILAAAFSEQREQLYDVDLCLPIALVFGNEMRGLSEEAVTGADCSVVIPMLGMVQSLNISVACAVALYEAMRQRRAAGRYDTPSLSEETMANLEADWLTR